MPALYLTGSSGALSASIRELYLERGWEVVGFDRKDDGFKHTQYQFIAANALDAASMFEAFNRPTSPPRALIATVGGIKPWMNAEEIPPTDFDLVIQLNLHSVFYAIRAALGRMYEAATGTIITIGAEPALRPEAKKAAYVAAKAGVIALTRVIAEEGKERGVNANVIVPTMIHTKANEEWGTAEEIPKWTPPESIAETAFFLCSEAGKSINGAVIRMPNRL
jgi:NAD(P)-dependent dehydrogenase (short-subunit alcohol dehydrogenase family)